MNGEMYQVCCIAAAARKALKEGRDIEYTPVQYEHRIEFQFLPEKKLLGTRSVKAGDVPEWFNRCRKKGLLDIKMIAPIQVKDRNILGFSNTSQSSLLCFYKNSQVNFFIPKWEFDDVQKGWNILYTEQEWKNPPREKPEFVNNTEAFSDILVKIEELARTIECDNFADIFKKARSVLGGEMLPARDSRRVPLPQIPDRQLSIFEAASMADVFGAMGSWNDSPPYMAHEKGLDQEFEDLSAELLTQLRMAVLYAVNG